MTTRTPWIMGNWKLNPPTTAQANALAADVLTNCPPLSAVNAKVAVFPSCIHFAAVEALLADSAIQVGVQAVSYIAATTGAFTGEVSAAVAAGAGAQLTLVGHSERRHVITETASQRLAQISQALTQQLTVVLCIGELLSEREAGLAQTVVKQQLDELFAADMPALATAIAQQQLVIAYEPVWAIGTGKTASSEDAQAMHAFVRATLATYAPSYANVAVVYGGSVNPTNAVDFAACADIDGVLVGGASLQADSFCAIISAFAS